METTLKQIQANYENVLARVAIATEKSGRQPQSVTIVGVTKYVSPSVAELLAESGCLDLGESRPQSLWEKAASLANPSLRWHLIGHLQRNKVKRTLPLVELIHSVDSERILEQIQSEAITLNCSVQVLLELNVTNDLSKTGLMQDDARKLLDRWFRSGTEQDGPIRQKAINQGTTNHNGVNLVGGVSIVGVMGMSSLGAKESQIHAEFESIRSIRNHWETEFAISLPVLSMGMSDDFEIAIEHGATHIRLGSVLFAS